MSAAKTGFVELPDTCSVAEALRKYSGHKLWSTLYTNKVSKSQPLLDKSYDCRTDEIVSENIRKAENKVAAMGDDCRISRAKEVREGQGSKKWQNWRKK